MLKNLTIDDDVFKFFVEEEHRMLMVDAFKNTQLQYFSESLYEEILEFSAIVQKSVRELKRKISELRRICVTSNTDGKDKAKQISDFESHITELETMVNDLMQVINQE